MIPERRKCLRHKLQGPAFASFDGVTGGMILDLSEAGLSMQTALPPRSLEPSGSQPEFARSSDPRRDHGVYCLGRCSGPCRRPFLRTARRVATTA